MKDFERKLTERYKSWNLAREFEMSDRLQMIKEMELEYRQWYYSQRN